MRQLTSIVAVNQAGVIGCRNALPWRVKSDLAFFKTVTTGNIVLMGRKTYTSLGKCLPNRYNVVLSTQFGLFPDEDGCVLRTGLAEGLTEVERAPGQYGEAFVIGGATMYTQFDPFVDRYLITIVDKQVEDGDAFFDLTVMNRASEWHIERKVARTQGDNDEAAYEIFELRHRHPEDRAAKRQEVISSVVPKRTTTRRSPRLQSGAIQSPSFVWS